MQVVNSVLARIGIRVQRARTVESLLTHARVSKEIIAALTASVVETENLAAEGIVFSMDRAMQLEAFLSSYLANVRNPAPIHILYRASSDSHRLSYEQALAPFGAILRSVSVQPDRASFRSQLLDIMKRIDSPKMLLFVDDDIFVEPFDLTDILRIDTRGAVPALRLGANLSRSYMLQKAQPLPQLRRWDGVAPGVPDRSLTITDTNRDDLLCWRWSEGQYDWAYPLSVDGHLFSTAEIRILAQNLAFDSPNSFEAGLQAFSDFFNCRLGICYRKSRLVNVPWNKVQTDNANSHGSAHQDSLLRLWQQGFRIDYESLHQMNNEGAHEEVTLRLRERETGKQVSLPVPH